MEVGRVGTVSLGLVDPGAPVGVIPEIFVGAGRGAFVGIGRAGFVGAAVPDEASGSTGTARTWPVLRGGFVGIGVRRFIRVGSGSIVGIGLSVGAAAMEVGKGASSRDSRRSGARKKSRIPTTRIPTATKAAAGRAIWLKVIRGPLRL
jgi:hypothetical protein